MTDFDSTYRAAIRFRKASRELEWLLRAVYESYANASQLRASLASLLEFLASASGRTDANCSTTYNFITATEPAWREVPDALRAILDDMSGTLQDSIYAPDIARTFESTPEQLLERLRKLA
jgi:hypothetical protein